MAVHRKLTLGVVRLVAAEAPWRQHPATEKQTALLHKLGVATHQGLTKGAAADLLAAVLGDWGERDARARGNITDVIATTNHRGHNHGRTT